VERYPNISDHGLIGDLQTAALVTTEGTIDFFCCPRFDSPSVQGAVFRGADGMELTLHSSGKRDPGDPDTAKITRHGDGLRAAFTLREGQTGGVVLESMGGKPRAVSPTEIARLAEGTSAFWKNWLGRSTYTGRWREMVSRSAMTLKMLIYQPTGAPVAAATLGLPEQAGGERNWDYRFTWIRDGSLTIHALAGLGYLEEAGRFGAWMQIAHRGWLALTKIIDWVADNWDQPDEGIWETRGGRKDFTYGRFQCWVALDRAIRLAERHGRPANVANWAVERDRIYNQIMQRGWNKKAKAFTHLSLINAAITLNRELDRAANPAEPALAAPL
jgi:GH15 family glucan-1,4-alpha-glucosidase